MGNPERITCPLPMPSIGGYMKRGVIRTWQIDAICQCVDSGISGALESVNFPHPVPKYVRGDMHQGRHISSRHVTACLRIVVYTSHNCSRKVGFLVYEAQLYGSENEIKQHGCFHQIWIDFSEELVVALSDRWLRYERTSTQARAVRCDSVFVQMMMYSTLHFLWCKIAS